jgi:hypothetical protein
MRTAQIKPRLGTVRNNRAFYAWYLAHKRLARIGGSVAAGLRVTQSDQQRETEDGQSRES